ncbi:MAG: T9SS type A sorting domain-containing protein [Bacteroidales bacterium]|nr:T9SS type A sorting domain-containing protein [Bacteroidales bacterium]
MKLIIILSFLLVFSLAKAQEQIVPLSGNPTLINTKQVSQQSTKTHKKGTTPAIKLPFIDDFSKPGYFPYKNLWEDSYVFINKSYAINPPSIGVATFDGTDNNGRVYSNMSTYPTIADTLTSNDIRLDTLFITNTKMTPADSVYLSFYVQPQGFGDAPQEGDSITLEFYDQNKDKWIHAWGMEGMPLDTLKKYYGVDFLHVLIPIKDTIFFGPRFKFRFLNYASIPGSNIPSWRSGVYDHWNLDYIILDANRSYDDIYFNDVSISGKLTTLLNDYQSMPWNQFLANASSEMDHSKQIEFTRQDEILGPINVAQYFGIYPLDYTTIPFHPPSNPASINMTTPTLDFAPNYTTYTYNSTATTYADFKVEVQVLHNPDIIRSNDTLKFFQRFYNYYAYDDGVPEAGYGLSTANGQLAIKFKTNIADSIQSVQFYFNQTLAAANQQYFDIQIWNDNGGAPGTVIYTQSSVRPEFSDDLFKFHTYVLDNAVAVNGTFYVGWKQSTKDNLNLGWDYNNNNMDNVFYNVTGNWYNSSFEGTAMIRPILGSDDQAYVGIPSKTNDDISLVIAPNPIHSNYLQLSLSGNKNYNNEDYHIRIFNINGQLIIESNYQNKIDVSNLQSGIYLIQLFTTNGQTQISKKFIINK